MPRLLLLIIHQDSAKFLQTIWGYGYRVYDCQQMAEIKEGKDGENTLAVIYQQGSSSTDLLLVHKTVKEFEGKDLADISCGY